MKKDLKMSLCLDVNSSSFKDDFCGMIEKYKPNFLIDTVGGEMSGKLFSWMPSQSEMILVGNLSSQDMSLCTTEFFIHNKRIRGFNLEDYLRDEVSDDNRIFNFTYNRKRFFQIIQDDINSGGKIFGATIAKEMNLDQWNEALN